MWKTLISSNSPYIFIVSELDYVCYCKYLQCLHEADEPLPGSKSASAIEAHAKNPTGSLWILDQHEPAFIHFLKSMLLKHFSSGTSHFHHSLTLLRKISHASFPLEREPHVGFMPLVDMRNEWLFLVRCLVDIRVSIFHVDALTICTTVSQISFASKAVVEIASMHTARFLHKNRYCRKLEDKTSGMGLPQMNTRGQSRMLFSPLLLGSMGLYLEAKI